MTKDSSEDGLYTMLCHDLADLIVGKTPESKPSAGYSPAVVKIKAAIARPHNVEKKIDAIKGMKNDTTITNDYIGSVLGRGLAIAIMGGANKDKMEHFILNAQSQVSSEVTDLAFSHALFIICSSKEVSAEQQHIIKDFLEVCQDNLGYEKTHHIMSNALAMNDLEIVGAKDGWKELLKEESAKILDPNAKPAKVIHAVDSKTKQVKTRSESEEMEVC